MTPPIIISTLRRMGLLKQAERAIRPIRFELRRRRLRRFYGQFLGPDALCFDIGGNMGHWTRVMLDLGARVVCVEPQDTCLARLHRRFGHRRDVTIVAAAISDREGEAELNLSRTSTELATLASHWRDDGPYRNSGWEGTCRVPTTTLDRLIEQHGEPAFIKIDVEGHEGAVLAGLSRPVAMLSFEFTQQFLPHADDCLQRLEALGMDRFNVSFVHDLGWGSPMWLDREAVLELIRATPQGWAGDLYACRDGGEPSSLAVPSA